MHKKGSGSKNDGGAGLAREKAEEKAQSEKMIIMLKAHKIFILHRTVMWCDPSCLEAFEKNLVVIPVVEMQEVRRKANAADRDFGSWKFIQNFGDYGRRYNGRGIFKTRCGSSVMLDTNGNNFEDLSPGLERSQENRIFLIGWNIINQLCQAKMKEKRGNLTELEIEEVRKKIIIVSSDPAIILMGQNEGLETQEYRSGNFISNINDLYTGIIDLKIKASVKDMIEMIPEDDGEKKEPTKAIKVKKLAKYVQISDLYPNQCCILRFNDEIRYAIYKKGKKFFRIIDQRPKKEEGKIGPKNMEQCFFEALNDDEEIALITVTGDAGTGKTIMAAKVHLDMLKDRSQSHMSVTVYRPIVDNGDKLGFLPGDYGEKINPYLQPVLDVFCYVANDGSHVNISSRKNSFDQEMLAAKNGAESSVAGYLRSGRLNLESINFIQGKTLHNTKVIMDESQDFTKPEAVAALTRIGNNGKIIMTGDLNQIHRPFLQPTASGLVWVVESMKNSELAAHITFTEVFRHPLVEEISNLHKR